MIMTKKTDAMEKWFEDNMGHSFEEGLQNMPSETLKRLIENRCPGFFEMSDEERDAYIADLEKQVETQERFEGSGLNVVTDKKGGQ